MKIKSSVSKISDPYFKDIQVKTEKTENYQLNESVNPYRRQEFRESVCIIKNCMHCRRVFV